MHKKDLNLPLEQRTRLWKRDDEELEAYCREPVQERRRPEVVDVPDPWKVALTYCSEEDRKRTKRSKPRRETKPKSKKPPPATLSSGEIEDLKAYFCYFDGVCGLRSSWSEQMDVISQLPPMKPEELKVDEDGACLECGLHHAKGAEHESSRVYVNPSHSGSRSYDDELLGVVAGREMERANMVRAALVEMVERGWQDSVRHLWRAYGPVKSLYRMSPFGELAQLIDQTVIAFQLSREFGLSRTEAVQKRLGMPGADLVAERLRVSAGKMLSTAVERYKCCLIL